MEDNGTLHIFGRSAIAVLTTNKAVIGCFTSWSGGLLSKWAVLGEKKLKSGPDLMQTIISLAPYFFMSGHIY